MRTSKYCCICGMPVDLRRKGASEMSNAVKEITSFKNPEYQYWCSEECQIKWKSGVRIK